MTGLRFSLCELPPSVAVLRDEVRAFLADASRDWSPEQLAHSWTLPNRSFSKELALRGWIGMTWPKQYGGHERSALERYVVLEELLAAGAPCGFHWVADRQSGPLLLRIGNEQQRKLVPEIASGDLSFCIGMSEPDAGSDLAAVRSRATRVNGGWRLNGRKIWTTNAQHADYMIALFRSGGAETARHEGLSQFIVDMRSSGLEIRPIRDLTGEEDFNEITFDDVFVPDQMLVGAEGNGWQQVISELTLERSGPERYLTSFPLLAEAVRTARSDPALAGDRSVEENLGELIAQHAVLRQMSLSVAGMLNEGEDPAIEAAVVKDLGNSLEQHVPEAIRTLLDAPSGSSELPAHCMLSFLVQAAPSFSLRGGTREVLRGIIARGLGLR